jgi:T5SS/PEP-CTERM-associated repeat protein
MSGRAMRVAGGALPPIACLLVALAPQVSRAEIVIDGSQAAASIQVMSGSFDPAFVAPVEQLQTPVTSFAADLAATPAGPFPATARASQTASAEASEGSFTFSSAGSVSVRVPGVPDPPLSNLFGQASSRVFLAFHVTERATVTASARAVASEADGAASIICSTQSQGVVERAGSSVSVALALEPSDSCNISALLTVSRNGNRDFLAPGEKEGSLRIDVSVSEQGPDDGTRFRWVGPAQGAFGDASHWENENGGSGVPEFRSFEDADSALVAGQAVLDLDLGGAALSRAALPRGAGASRRTGRLAVRTTQILRPLGGTLILDSLEPGIGERSLEIGGSRLLLDQGGVTARHAVVGHGGDGELEVIGPDGFFTTVGRLGVGGDADGSVAIRSGAQVTSAETVLGEEDGAGFAAVQDAGTLWQTGNLAVGFADDASLSIESGATVESGDALIDCQLSAGPDVPGCTGLDGDERAEVTVRGAGSSWVLRDLELGARGKVVVEGGALLDPSLVRIGTSGLEADCIAGRACLEVADGSVDAEGIAVGLSGAGKLRIGTAGRVSSLLGTLIGLGSGTRGDVIVTGPSPEAQLVGPLLIGTEIDGHGELVLEGGAQVAATAATVGGEPGSFGRVEIQADSTLHVDGGSLALGVDLDAPDAAIFGTTGEVALAGGRIELEDADLSILNTGEVSGSGSIDAFGVSLVTNDGVFGCGVAVNGSFTQGPEGVLQCAQAGPPAAPQLSPLALGRFVRGLRARPVPPPPPPTGPFVVSGDATLGGRLVLQFLNGFAPSQGDAFELLDVSGAVAGSFAGIEVRGLAPGADFAQDFTGGKLMLTALTDAESLPVVSVKAKPKLQEGKPKKGLKVKIARKGDTSQALAVRYVLRGTARNGFDYEALPGTIEIPAKKRSAKLALRAFPDGVAEGVETVSVEILPGENYTTSLFAAVEVAISDEKPKRR